MKEIGLFLVNEPTLVKEDNTSAIALAEHGSGTRSRHFNIAFYKLKDVIQFGDMGLVRVDTADNEADFFTKALAPAKFIKHRDYITGGADVQSYFETKDPVLPPILQAADAGCASNLFTNIYGDLDPQECRLQSDYLHSVILPGSGVEVDVPSSGELGDLGPAFRS